MRIAREFCDLSEGLTRKAVVVLVLEHDQTGLLARAPGRLGPAGRAHGDGSFLDDVDDAAAS